MKRSNLIDQRYELAKLAAPIDWSACGQAWEPKFKSTTGRPALPTRLMASLLHLRHMFVLSDEATWASAGWRTRPGSTSAASALSGTSCPSMIHRAWCGGGSAQARKAESGCLSSASRRRCWLDEAPELCHGDRGHYAAFEGDCAPH
jgi:IS5 family transposase